MKPLRERDEFKRGRAGELVVDAWLKRRGCYVIPSYDYAGENGDKAPRLQGLWTGHPVPDLDVSKEGYRFWAEVKTKAAPNIWRGPKPWGESNTPEHGIDLSLAQHYRMVEIISGSPAWLFIYEESSRWLLAQRFAVLGKSRIGTCNGKKMINWPRASFRELDRIEP